MDEGKEVTTEELNLKLTGIGTRRNRSIFLCKVLIVPSLPSSLKGSIAKNRDIVRWPHLQDIPPTCIPGGVDLLIGLDTPQALLPLEIRAGGDGEPFATRTLLGWTVNGPMRFEDGEPIGATNVRTTGMTAIAQRQQSAIRYGSILGSDFSLHCGDTISMEDRRVIELWSSTTQQVDRHYQLPIPFRYKEPGLPNNLKLAERRLIELRRRLMRDPALCLRYQREMKRLVDEGHAERALHLDSPPAAGTVWYLPHHPVLNHKKPEKVRIVFDCAATYMSTSLNDQVMQRPDLNNDLMGVLLRFRQDRVAIMADIEAMFHQVLVPREHRDALRFL
ncbi:uncharacterized protein LOC123511097 [Portunus trituberculatus]|uniref:uncharacterized protein LOC123511097 n=1 Tax=Portunus trituberculatus TaxID=210409 RepID=UPI001E1CB743|nr:uncharacterized protein LOC123511097 [Portunus trituberculatus]